MKPPVLALRQVRLADGPRMLFDGVDLALELRCRACLVGRNGAGKTTLLRILAGEVEVDDGEKTQVPGLRIAWVPQEPVITGPTVLDHLIAAGAAPHEAEAALQLSAEYVLAETGLPPEFLIQTADSTRAALRQVLSDDPDIKILVLAAAVGGRGPGPLLASIAKEGVKWGTRKVPITIVPGDLTDDEIADLA